MKRSFLPKKRNRKIFNFQIAKIGIKRKNNSIIFIKVN
jgi:hypothetical protein